MSPILTGVIASGISGNLWAPSGAYDSIATTTVGAGGASSITFSSIPQTYTHLQLRCSVGLNAVADYVMRFNNDSAGNYRQHNLYGDGSAASTYNYGNGETFISFAFPFQGLNSLTSFAGNVTDILDYTNTNKNKVSRSLLGTDRNGSGQVALESGLWINTSAVNRIDILPGSSSFLQYSQFALYGIKGN
jgi:hypothetical protein